jgi:hypothetical protein
MRTPDFACVDTILRPLVVFLPAEEMRCIAVLAKYTSAKTAQENPATAIAGFSTRRNYINRSGTKNP